VISIQENEISEKIIGCSIEVHRLLGSGLLESAYVECLFYELEKARLFVEKQKPLPLVYKEVRLDAGYRIDLIVENKVIIEIKSVECLNDIHTAQVLTYLKLSGCKVGLLMNFNVLRITDGLKRLVNKF
jgi:GxxExxY protein